MKRGSYEHTPARGQTGLPRACRRAQSLLGLALLALLLGCEQDETRPNFEYSPDMVASQAHDAFAENPALPSGQTLLKPPEGSIARGAAPLHFGKGPEEASRAGVELQNPIERSPHALARGELAFNRYCTACHGVSGVGDGPATIRFPQPPSLLGPRAMGIADGQMFHIITHGQGLMPAHGAQVRAEDRWQIVHWVRRMQRNVKLTQKATP